MFEAYVNKPAFDKAVAHARDHAQRGKEALGLLVGRAAQWRGTPYVVVDDYVTADNDATSASVRFSAAAFSALAREINGRHRGKLVVGWCHSHPNYGCFLSGTDVRTQSTFFDEAFHVALVVDPVRDDARAFKLDGAGRYREASFAVIERKKSQREL